MSESKTRRKLVSAFRKRSMASRPVLNPTVSGSVPIRKPKTDDPVSNSVNSFTQRQFTNRNIRSKLNARGRMASQNAPVFAIAIFY